MSQPKQQPCALTIASSDSSGGAGIQADIKAISATGAYAASVIVALTAQNTMGVHAVYALPETFIMQQIDSVFTDLNIQAVKIGMLNNQAIIKTVATGLKKYQPAHIVLDPVMVSKSGYDLLDPAALDSLKKDLLPLVTLITPNLLEAEKLLNKKIKSRADMEQAAVVLSNEYSASVLVKGGHLTDDQSSDVLYVQATKQCHWFHAERITSKNTHGTGCTLSAAIASYLAQGDQLPSAIKKAKLYLTQAITQGAHQFIGHGHGPVDHFYVLKK